MLTGRDWGDKPAIFEKWTTVHLIINGKDHDELPDGLTVAGLIAHLELPERKIAVERNREVVPKSQYDTTQLSNHDTLEIIHFIGGG